MLRRQYGLATPERPPESIIDARRCGGDPREERPESEALAAAKREYLAMLEADAVKGKGGRPRKKAGIPAADTEEKGPGDELQDE